MKYSSKESINDIHDQEDELNSDSCTFELDEAEK